MDDGQGETPVAYCAILRYRWLRYLPSLPTKLMGCGLWVVGLWVVAGCVGFDWTVDSGGAMNFSLGGNYVFHKWD